jgi:putative salt-induced outer membrane protein YdiY
MVTALLGAPGVASAIPDTSEPPQASETELDWVKLVSGEWLRGEVQSLRVKDFEFDSDKLKLLTLDWDDVTELHSARVRTYRFDQEGVIIGPAAMKDGVVRIRTAAGIREFPKDTLLLILEGHGREWDYWSSKVSIGFVARAGNSDQADFNASGRVRRRTPRLRSELTYAGNVSEIEGIRTLNNHNANLDIDAVLSAGFFITLGSINYFVDEFQNVEYRTTLGAGLGYDIMRGGDVEWKVGFKGAYQTTNYVSVQEDEDDRESTGSLIPSTGLDVEFTKTIDFAFSYEVQVSVPEVENAFHHAFGVFSFEIWGDVFDLDVSLNWDRVENPKRNADGILPVRDDFRTSLGIGLTF